MHEQLKLQSVETRSSWVVASMTLLILAVSFGAPWITVVALKLIAEDMGGLRSIAASANSLAWIGYGAGGIVMGYVAERIGIRWTVMFGAVMICVGLALSAIGVYFHAGHPASRGIEGLLRGERVQSARASALPHNSLKIDPDEGRRYASLVELIRREVPADASIFAVPSNAELYFLAERRNAFRFYNTALGVRTDEDLARV